jgi:hypothetical protein
MGARDWGSVRDEYDESARAVISRAVEEAHALGRHHVGTEHLLLGWIILRRALKDPTEMDPDLARFIAAHEAAHLARDDSMTEDLAGVGRFCIAVIAVLTRPDTWWLLMPLVALLPVIRWRAELACDRMAVQITGRIPARREIAYLRWVERQSRRRRPLRRLGFWLWGLRTHPTCRIRCDAIARILANEKQATVSHYSKAEINDLPHSRTNALLGA